FNQPITYTNASTGEVMQIPISAITSKEMGKQFSKIKRRGYERTIVVYSNVLGEYNPTETVNKIKAKMKQVNYTMPKDMTYSFTGEQEKQAENMSFLVGALLMALGGIILIIVAQFN